LAFSSSVLSNSSVIRPILLKTAIREKGMIKHIVIVTLKIHEALVRKAFQWEKYPHAFATAE
jgi:hypothetical protein